MGGRGLGTRLGELLFGLLDFVIPSSELRSPLTHNFDDLTLFLFQRTDPCSQVDDCGLLVSDQGIL